MSYYNDNDYRDYLAHHGILGQKWGKRNGPPYPLGYGDHSASEKKAGWERSLSSSSTEDTKRKKADVERKKKFVTDLSEELNKTWDYGALVDGKKVTDIDNFNWEKNYRTIPLETLEKEKIGNCWDFVNYQHDKLNKAGIKNDSYLLMMKLPTKENPDRVVTHTFTTFDLDGKTYWLESAMWPKRGVHEIKNYESAAKEIHSVYSDKPTPFSLFKYNPEGLDKNLTDTEFFDRVTEDNWIGDYNTRGKSK